jgi:flagellin
MVGTNQKIKEDLIMALRINTNVAALNAHRQLLITEGAMNSSMQKLSSGYRINNAGDDASGLVQANTLRSSIRVMTVQAQTITQDKADYAIAQGDGQTIEAVLERMLELGAKSSTGQETQAEYLALAAEIDTIANASANTSIQGLTTAAGDLNVATWATRTNVSAAIDTVGQVLGQIGAQMNTLDFQYANIQTKIENTSASESAIRDVDMAAEMVTFTKTQIMMQAGTAMLAQANTSSQNILTLFR